MNEAYLLDAFGREPRNAPEQAHEALTAIWSAVLRMSSLPGSLV